MTVAPAEAPLRDKLAQLMFVRLGSDMPPKRSAEEDEPRIAALLGEIALGGLVVFNGTIDHTPRTIDRLQRRSRYPLLISADLERGAGQQLRPFPLVPHAMAFDALGPAAAEAVQRFARSSAEICRAAGIHITFAPVADVNSDPRNPIIATRAFSTAPGRASELVAAFVRGCQEGGLLATAKHFPGHGDTCEDSHDSVPTVGATALEISQRDLPPFRAAIDAGVPLVMTAHVRYPSLDRTAPATFSRTILQDLLRGELGFRGAVVSDSLLMEGATAGFADEGAIALAALNAGVDLLLDVAAPAATLARLETAVEAGQLSAERIDEAYQRVQQLKSAVAALPAPPVEMADAALGTESLALDVARRATTHLGGRQAPFTLDRRQSLCAVLINPFDQLANMPPPPLGSLLHDRFPRCDYFELKADPSADELSRIRQAALAADQFLAAFVVKPAAWHRFGLPPAIRQWLQHLVAARPTVVACLGAPQGLEPFAEAAMLLCTYSDVPASHHALVERLAGPTT